jgi:competence protein ComEC
VGLIQKVKQLLKSEIEENHKKPWFIKEPEITVYDKDKGEPKIIDTLIFGDEIGIRNNKTDNEYLAITYKKNGNLLDGFIKKSSSRTQNRMLELYFIDVGQGDSILINTPYNEKILIDGGPDNTMHKFLQSKYNSTQVDFDAIIMTHADKDHSAGLVHVFNDEKIHTKAFLHNGIAKFQGTTFPIGKTEGEGDNKVLVETFSDINDLGSSNRVLGQQFATLIQALKNYRSRNPDLNLNIRRIDHNTGELELEDIERSSTGVQEQFRIRVLGPINVGSEEKPTYRCSKNNEGETINGNSISLLIEYGRCRILLCGDMNEAFEKRFMEFYREQEFQAHVFKANHHGSQHFCNEFLKRVSPSINVVSAGYAYNYGHPRAVLLGGLGRYSSDNTEEPLIFVTKISGTYRKINIKTIIARSTTIFNEFKEIIGEKFRGLVKLFNSRERAKSKLFSDLLSNVYQKSKDGSIYIRTDGTTIVAARILSMSNSIKTKWELYSFTIEEKRLIKHKT